MTDLAPPFGLARQTALGGTTPRIDRIGAVTITEFPDLSIASVALRRGGVAPDLPEAGNHADGAIWAGPEQWLLTGPHDLQFAARVKSRFGDRASVTDQTDGWAAFDVVAPDALLKRLCNIDVGKMHSGHATRTVIEHLGCFVLRNEAGFRIFGARSSASFLHHALMSAAEALR